MRYQLKPNIEQALLNLHPEWFDLVPDEDHKIIIRTGRGGIYDQMHDHDKRKAEYPARPDEAIPAHVLEANKPWWETCTKLALVLFSFNDNPQVRVLSGTGATNETPRNTFKGQFYAHDARVLAALKRVSGSTELTNSENVSILMWSPAMDSTWLFSDTQPLYKSL